MHVPNCRIFQLHCDEEGQGLVEYALIMGLVSLSAVVALNTIANDVSVAFTGIAWILRSYVP